MLSRRGGQPIWWILGTVAVVIGVLYALASVRGPFWLGPYLDPEYVYLFNGLLLATGRPAVHVDHPGTVAQELIATVIHLTPGGREQALAMRVTVGSEKYLAITRGVILLLSAGVFMASAWVTVRATQRVAAAVLTVAAVLFTPMAMAEAISVKAEPFLLMAGVAIGAMAVLAASTFSQTGWRLAVLMGATAGIALAAKVTAIPLVAVAVIGVRGWRARAIVVAAMTVTVAVLLIPAYPELTSLWKIVGKIATQPGRYGNGGPPAMAEGNLLALLYRLAEVPAMVLGLALTLIGFWTQWRARQRGDATSPFTWACVALATGIVMQMAIVAKHPYATRYLLPGVALAGPAMVAGIVTIGLRWRAWMAALGGMAAVAGVAVTYGQLTSITDAHQRDHELLAGELRGRPVVNFYCASTRGYAMSAANWWTRGVFAGEMAIAEPEAVNFDLWAGRTYVGFGPPMSLETALTGRHVLFRGAQPTVMPNLPPHLWPGKRLAVGDGLDGFYELAIDPSIDLPFGDYHAKGLGRGLIIAGRPTRILIDRAELTYPRDGAKRTLSGKAHTLYPGGASLRIIEGGRELAILRIAGPDEPPTFRIPLTGGGKVRLEMGPEPAAIQFDRLRIDPTPETGHTQP